MNRHENHRCSKNKNKDKDQDNECIDLIRSLIDEVALLKKEIMKLTSSGNPPVVSAIPVQCSDNPPVSSDHPPVSSDHPLLSSTNPPLSSDHPPLSSTNPPLSSDYPPLSSDNPPVVSSNPILSSTEPPLSSDHFPVSSTNPPVSSDYPPLSNNEPTIKKTKIRKVKKQVVSDTDSEDTQSLDNKPVASVINETKPIAQILPTDPSIKRSYNRVPVLEDDEDIPEKYEDPIIQFQREYKEKAGHLKLPTETELKYNARVLLRDSNTSKDLILTIIDRDEHHFLYSTDRSLWVGERHPMLFERDGEQEQYLDDNDEPVFIYEVWSLFQYNQLPIHQVNYCKYIFDDLRRPMTGHYIRELPARKVVKKITETEVKTETASAPSLELSGCGCDIAVTDYMVNKKFIWRKDGIKEYLNDMKDDASLSKWKREFSKLAAYVIKDGQLTKKEY